MNSAYRIIESLMPLARHFASPDYDKAIEFLLQELPFAVHVYGTESEHNGWVIPPKHHVKKAVIKKQGAVIYDGLSHALGVPCHAASFQGSVDKNTLLEHLWYDHRFPDAIPYHFRFSYRPWERSWGFCVSKTFYDSLTDGIYEIDLEVEDGIPELKVLEYTLWGNSGIEFAFVAHLDHPGMANDDLAGCAVGVDLFQHLSKRTLRHTYRLFLVQEIIGSEMLMHSNSLLQKMNEALFLEMLGVDVPFVVQRANGTLTSMELALRECLQQKNIHFKEVGFRESVTNDEIVFESYGVPTVSLCRFPYPEYHSSKDNLTITSRKRLQESVDLLKDVVCWHESDVYVEKLFAGVTSLANPKFNLYVDPGQPAFGDQQLQLPLHHLMDRLPLLSGRQSVKVLAARHGLPMRAALEYLKRCQEKNLVSLF